MPKRYLFLFLALAALAGKVPVAYAAGEQVVTYCIDPDWMPYEAMRNGKHIGISADYLDVISKLSHLKFELIPTESWQDSLAAVESGACMVTTMINRTPSRSHFLNFTTPYIEVPNVLVGRNGTPMVQGFEGVGNRIVGVVSGFRHAEYLARYYPDLLTEYVDSEVSGLQKLSKGDIDLMVGSLMGVYSAINAHDFSDLQIVGFAEPFDMLSFGVNKNHAELVPLLNKAISAIPESRKVDIYKRWNAVRQVKQGRYGFVLGIVFIAIALVAVAAWRKRVISSYQRQISQKNDEIESLQSSLLEKNRTLEFLSTRDEVTGLYNRNYFMQKAEEEISRHLRFQSPCTLIAIEITENGNKLRAGAHTDSLCKRLTSACLTTVRDVDITARCEPDKFMILSPQTTLAAGDSLANRLLECLKAEADPTIIFITGVAELQSGQRYSEWNDDLNRALSASRRQGGNVVALAE